MRNGRRRLAQRPKWVSLVKTIIIKCGVSEGLKYKSGVFGAGPTWAHSDWLLYRRSHDVGPAKTWAQSDRSSIRRARDWAQVTVDQISLTIGWAHLKNVTVGSDWKSGPIHSFDWAQQVTDTLHPLGMPEFTPRVSRFFCLSHRRWLSAQLVRMP